MQCVIGDLPAAEGRKDRSPGLLPGDSFDQDHSDRYHCQAGANPGQLEIDWGDGNKNHINLTAGLQTWTPTHTYQDSGDYIVKVSVTGAHPESTNTSYTVKNKNPIIVNQGTISNTNAQAGITELTISGIKFKDPSPKDDTFKVVIDWGDDSTKTTFDIAASAKLVASFYDTVRLLVNVQRNCRRCAVAHHGSLIRRQM